MKSNVVIPSSKAIAAWNMETTSNQVPSAPPKDAPSTPTTSVESDHSSSEIKVPMGSQATSSFGKEIVIATKAASAFSVRKKDPGNQGFLDLFDTAFDAFGGLSQEGEISDNVNKPSETVEKAQKIQDSALITDRENRTEPGAEQMSDPNQQLFDAKLQTMEQKLVTLETKLDGKLDLITEKVSGLHSRMDDIHTRIGDVWTVMIGIGAATLIAILGIYIQNGLQGPDKQPSVQVSTQAPAAPPVTNPPDPQKKK